MFMQNAVPRVEYDKENKQCAVFLSAKITCPCCNQVVNEIKNMDSTKKGARSFACSSCKIQFSLIPKRLAFLARNEKIKVQFYDVEFIGETT